MEIFDININLYISYSLLMYEIGTKQPVGVVRIQYEKQDFHISKDKVF